MLLGYGKSWLIDKDRKWLGACYQPALLDLFPLSLLSCSLIAQLVMNPPAIQETLVQFLGREDALEKRKSTHSSILAWRIPWTA